MSWGFEARKAAATEYGKARAETWGRRRRIGRILGMIAIVVLIVGVIWAGGGHLG